MKKTFVYLLVLVFVCSFGFSGEEWSRFRGPNGSGTAGAGSLPTRFGGSEQGIWKTPLMPGHSSPVLTEHRILLTGYQDEKLFTMCLDRADGKLLWRREVPRPRKEPFHRTHGPASASPATDGKNVFCFFGDFGAISYDLNGAERWKVPLGPFSIPNGHGSSPILAEGLVVIQVDQDQGSYLLALDQRDGSVRWKTPRPEATHGYSTPCLYVAEDGSAQIIVAGSYQVSSYSVKDGKKMWWARGLTWQVKPSPVVNDGVVYLTGWAPGADAGEGQVLPAFDEAIAAGDTDKNGLISEAEAVAGGWRHSGGWALVDLDNDGELNRVDWEFFRARRSSRNATFAVRPGGSTGDVTDKGVLWRYMKAVSQVSSPLVHEGVVYTIKDGGILTAFDAETGEVLKQGRVQGALDTYYASPVVGDGKIYLASEDGRIAVIRPGADWEVLTVNEMQEPVYATPAISGGVLYVRTMSAMYAFAK